MNELLEVKGLGKFTAYTDTDPNFSGVEIELVPEKETGNVSNPRMRMEYSYGRLRVFVWADKDSEDYTSCTEIKM